MPGIDLVIFDNDGVVVDSERVSNQALAQVLTELGHPTTVADSMRHYLGGTLAGVRERIRSRTGQELPPDFEDRYHERLFRAFAEDLKPVPGVRDVLMALKYPYCLASSGEPERIRYSLTATGLWDFFDGRIVSAQDVVHGKPAPDIFLLAASRMGAQPERTVVVEDSPVGVEAGIAAGMTVLAYAALTPEDRLHRAHHIFTRMEALPGLLAGLDW